IVSFLLHVSRHPPCSPFFPSTTLFRSLRPVRRQAYRPGKNARNKRNWRGRASIARRSDRPPRWAAPPILAWGDPTVVLLTPRLRSEEHTPELQSLTKLLFPLLLAKQKT